MWDQHLAGLLRPQPGDPAGLPPAGPSEQRERPADAAGRRVRRRVWRPVEGGIQATAFHRLSDEAWTGLEAEAGALVAFLADREPMAYRRYAYWWTTLPSAEVRVLPGW
jgi:hypothetical protein